MHTAAEIVVDQENDGLADYRGLRQLWAAVLRRGVLDYCDTLAGRHDHHREPGCPERTREWFWSEDADREGSFIWCCEFLGHDAERRRKYIMENFKKISDKGQKGGRRSGGH